MKQKTSSLSLWIDIEKGQCFIISSIFIVWEIIEITLRFKSTIGIPRLFFIKQKQLFLNANGSNAFIVKTLMKVMSEWLKTLVQTTYRMSQYEIDSSSFISTKIYMLILSCRGDSIRNIWHQCLYQFENEWHEMNMA